MRIEKGMPDPVELVALVVALRLRASAGSPAATSGRCRPRLVPRRHLRHAPDFIGPRTWLAGAR